jgi:hypothetical protein
MEIEEMVISEAMDEMTIMFETVRIMEGNRGKYLGNRGGHNSFRGNRNDRGRGSWNNNNRNGGNKDIRCHKCSKFRHYARECPERGGLTCQNKIVNIYSCTVQITQN